MKLLLPDNTPLDPDLPPGVEAVSYDVTVPVPDEHLDAEALVTWSNRHSALAESVARMPRLRWIQSLSAGTEHLLALDLPEHVVITSGVGLHDGPVSEHTLALTLALVRHLPRITRAQAERRWDEELAGSQAPRGAGEPITSLQDAEVLVWGFGSIGQRLAPLLAALGARVRGVARSAGERSGFEVLAESDLDEALPGTDLLIMILPSSPATAKALDARRLELLPDHAFLVNVGRGATVDEEALVAAMRSGGLAGAALDVMAVEPLPPESPLWEAPNVLISPHAAGGRPVGSSERIARNLAALLEGRELVNVVAR